MLSTSLNKNFSFQNTYLGSYSQVAIDSPTIKFNPKKGTLIINGCCDKKNGFSQLHHTLPILIDEYLKKNQRLSCYLFFRNLNTHKTQILFQVFKMLSSHEPKGKEITVTWFSDRIDHATHGVGEDFSDLFDLNVNIVRL